MEVQWFNTQTYLHSYSSLRQEWCQISGWYYRPIQESEIQGHCVTLWPWHSEHRVTLSWHITILCYQQTPCIKHHNNIKSITTAFISTPLLWPDLFRIPRISSALGQRRIIKSFIYISTFNKLKFIVFLRYQSNYQFVTLNINLPWRSEGSSSERQRIYIVYRSNLISYNYLQGFTLQVILRLFSLESITDMLSSKEDWKMKQKIRLS